MKIDRMVLADFFTPEGLAASIIRQIKDLPIPIPVEEIAGAVGIEKIVEEDLDKIEGGLLANSEKTKGAILVNKRSWEERKRFTIGHELGHFLILDHYPESSNQSLCTHDDMKETDTSQNAKRMETEANMFSAHLLMPTSIFRREIKKTEILSIKDILQLANKFKTSKEATGNRYVHLVEKPCAVVFSKEGTIRYMNASPDFARLRFAKGDCLPNHMLEANRKENIGEVSEIKEKNGSIWCANNRFQPAPEYVFEQTLAHQNGYRMTLLYYEKYEYDDDLEEKVDEERELIDSWTPRFKR